MYDPRLPLRVAPRISPPPSSALYAARCGPKGEYAHLRPAGRWPGWQELSGRHRRFAAGAAPWCGTKTAGLGRAVRLVEVAVQGLAGFLGKENLAADFVAFPLHLAEMLALVLVEVQAQQFRHPQPRVQQHQEQGVIA